LVAGGFPLDWWVGRLVENKERTMSGEQVLWLIGALAGAVGLGVWLGSELWRRDAERWQWWRARHFALCSMACAKAAGLDLSRTYVQTPQQMDAVTDEALRKTPNV
jgi:hypothetical protein